MARIIILFLIRTTVTDLRVVCVCGTKYKIKKYYNIYIYYCAQADKNATERIEKQNHCMISPGKINTELTFCCVEEGGSSPDFKFQILYLLSYLYLF